MAASSYKSARSAGGLAIAALAIIVGLDVVGAFAAFSQIDLLERIASHGAFTHEEATLSDQRVEIISVVHVVAFVLSAVVFLRWFRVVHDNAKRSGAPLTGSLDMVWLSWFIPIVSLFRPYQITAAIWDGTVPATSAVATRSRAILGWWWALWIANNLAGRVSSAVSTFAKDDARKLIDATWVGLGKDAIDVAAAVCAILVIRRINERQEDSMIDALAARFD